MYNHIDRVINFALQYSTYPHAYPIEIGKIILRIYPEQNLLTSAILYSTIDHSSNKKIIKGLKQIKDYFGPHTAYKISNITKFSSYEYIAYDLTQIHKFTSALNRVDKTTNSSILLIKLARLLHSLSVFNNYYSLSHEQIKLISLDILEVYLPLISGVDIEDVKTELQEFCTKILYPNINKDIKKYLGVIESSEEFLNDVVEDLNKELSNSQIKATVSGRIKSYYSIWRKLHYKNTTIEKLNDIIGLRIIVDNTDDCYSALKVIHQRYQSLPKKFHDFIHMPKGNGYKSLHTVIVGPKSQKLEVQIRTTEMHQVAQGGSAAHWQYKYDCTKILSIFIAAQKLYTKPTVNFATPNSVTQHNSSNVNTNITVATIQLNTLAMHMSYIGLLTADNKKQSTDDKVATDDGQYITSHQTEYADSCVTIQPLVYGFINLLFKFMQDNVCNQIMIFIAGSDIVNLVNVTVEGKERKEQEFWDDISYVSNNYNINCNKQNKNSKNVSSNSKKEVVVVSHNSDMRGNCDQMLVNINSSVTENTDIAKTNTLTKTESNSNKLNSEQTTREEKQEINSTQDIFSTTLPVSNISYNTTNITNLYEPERQNEGVKFTDDGVQCFRSTPNTTTVSETKEDNTYLGCSSRDEGDNESKVIPDSENSTTNFENKASSAAPLLRTNDTVDDIEIEYTACPKRSSVDEGDNESKVVLDSENSTKPEQHVIKSSKYVAKTLEFREQLRHVIMYKLISDNRKRMAELTEHSSDRKASLKIQQLYNILNLYRNTYSENINFTCGFADITWIENTEQDIFIARKLIKYDIYQDLQINIGNPIIRYFYYMLPSNYTSDIEILTEMTLFLILYYFYYKRYDNTNKQYSLYQNFIQEMLTRNNIDWDVEQMTKNLQVYRKDEFDIGNDHESQDSKRINSINKPSGNKGDIDQDTKVIKCVKSGDLKHLSTEDIEKLRKISDQLQQLLNLKIGDKKDIEEMLKQWKCQSDVDCDAAPTTFSIVCGYVLVNLVIEILKYNYISFNKDLKALPDKILLKYLTTEFLCKINPEDQKSIMKAVREAIVKDIDNSQQMDDSKKMKEMKEMKDMDCISPCIADEIGLENAESIPVGEQHDSYNDHDNI